MSTRSADNEPRRNRAARTCGFKSSISWFANTFLPKNHALGDKTGGGVVCGSATLEAPVFPVRALQNALDSMCVGRILSVSKSFPKTGKDFVVPTSRENPTHLAGPDFDIAWTRERFCG